MNNDRFKFRVWDNWKKQYRYDCLVGMDGYPYEWGDFQSIELKDKGRCTIEQCTGLRDKNGKLIYEGDICACGAQTFKVEWENGGFAEFILPEMFDHAKCEIVGNIHEVKR